MGGISRSVPDVDDLMPCDLDNKRPQVLHQLARMAAARARAGVRMHAGTGTQRIERAKEGEESHVVCGRVAVGCADRGGGADVGGGWRVWQRDGT